MINKMSKIKCSTDNSTSSYFPHAISTRLYFNLLWQLSSNVPPFHEVIATLRFITVPNSSVTTLLTLSSTYTCGIFVRMLCRLTSDKFLENVDTVTAYHRSVQTNNIRVFQATPCLQLIRIKLQQVNLNNRNTLEHISTIRLYTDTVPFTLVHNE